MFIYSLPVSSLFWCTAMLCLHQCLPALSLHAHLDFFFLSQICIFVLCAMLLLYNSTCCTQPAFTCISNSLPQAPSSSLVLRIFIMPSPLPDQTPNSSSPLAITLSLFFIHGRYAETLWLLWKLPSSMLFHLSIISMMSLHSTDRYLETLQLL
jgi:hypothetical protein